MNKSELRLELLKLTYTPARSSEEAVARAKVLEAYVASGAEADQPKRRPGRRKQSGTDTP